MLLGLLAATPGAARRWFAAGTAAGGVVRCTARGHGARLLRPLSARPAAWRVLDVGVALVMSTLAVSLLRGP